MSSHQDCQVTAKKYSFRVKLGISKNNSTKLCTLFCEKRGSSFMAHVYLKHEQAHLMNRALFKFCVFYNTHILVWKSIWPSLQENPIQHIIIIKTLWTRISWTCFKTARFEFYMSSAFKPSSCPFSTRLPKMCSKVSWEKGGFGCTGNCMHLSFFIGTYGTIFAPKNFSRVVTSLTFSNLLFFK